MIGDKIIEIDQFDLRYDGIFILKINVDDKVYENNVYITPLMLLRIIENEGIESTSEKLELYEYVRFTKTILQLEVFEEADERISFLTSEEADMYQDNDLYLINIKIK